MIRAVGQNHFAGTRKGVNLSQIPASLHRRTQAGFGLRLPQQRIAVSLKPSMLPAACSMGSTPSSASSARPADQQVAVYVATVPLEGFEAAERLLGASYPEQAALHTLVILVEAGGRCTAFDFLPQHAKSPVTAAR